MDLTSSKSNGYYDCLADPDKYGYEIEYFWVSGVLLSIVGVMGLAGNVVNLIVLCQHELRQKVFYKLLAVLSFFDTIFIIAYGIGIGYRCLACQPQNDNVNDITYPFLNIGFAGSVYTTVAISLERYFAVCRPRLKNNRKTWIYVVPVIIVTFAYNLPRFFEHNYNIVNGTLESSRTEWSMRESYIQNYWFWTAVSIEFVIPLCLLLMLNGGIILMIYRTSNKIRGTILKQQKQTTKILLLIVSIFLICNIPDIIYKCLYHLGPSDDAYRQSWYFIAPIKQLALMFNSSINSIIYCLVGNTFRKVLYRCFRFEGMVKRFSMTTTGTTMPVFDKN